MATNEELVAMIQNGERDKLPELWNQVERFVRWQAYQAYRRILLKGDIGGATQEDLYQSGYLALVSAVDYFDPERGLPFIGLLALTLKSAFAEAGGYRSRKQKKDPLRHSRSLDAPLSDDESDGDSLMNLVPASDDPIAEAEERIYAEQLHTALETALRQLPEDEESVIRARYYQGRTLREIGPQAHNVEARAMDHLRRSTISRELRQFIELRTPYYKHVGINTFNGSHTSAVELAVLLREQLENQAPLADDKRKG